MASLNPLTRELVFKLVFYGPGLGGKTSTLQFIFDATKPEHRGKMVSLATPTDRTLYFDFLPLRMPRIRGMSVRLQLFTVPGQMYFAATRKLVLAGSDGIVFVADSQAARFDANRESMEDLKANLAEHGRDLEHVPHTLQFNKRDLDDTTPIEELDRALNMYAAPSRGTVATNGAGVFSGLEDIARRVIRAYEIEQPRGDASPSLVPGSAPGSSEVGLEEAIRGLTDRVTHATPPQGMLAVVVPRNLKAEPDAAAGATSPPPPMAAEAIAAEARHVQILHQPASPPGAPEAESAAEKGREEASDAAESREPTSGEPPRHVDGATEPPPPPSAEANEEDLVERVPVDADAPPPHRAWTSGAAADAPAAPPAAVSAVRVVDEEESDQDVTQVFDSAATAHRAESRPPAAQPTAIPASGPTVMPSRPDALATTERAAPGSRRISSDSLAAAIPPNSGPFSLAPLWPDAERALVREAEAMLGTGDGAAAMRVCEPLVFRALASAAVLVGGAEAPREPALTALLLGIDGARYLAFRIAARRARAGDPVDPAAAYDALLLALEARRVRDRIERS
jgi:signal recognition particle receptor subunit beta